MSSSISRKNIILQEATTYFIVPFSFGGRIGYDNFKLPDDSLWESTDMQVGEDVFYRHIQDFLMGSVIKDYDKGKRQNFELLVYSMKQKKLDDSRLEEERRMLKKLMTTEFCLKVREKGDEDDRGVNVKDGYRYIPFRIPLFEETRKFHSPKLMVYPDASLGLLIVPVTFNVDKERKERKDFLMPKELKSFMTIYDLMVANYQLHKTKDRVALVKPMRAVWLKLLDRESLSEYHKTYYDKEANALANTRKNLYAALNVRKADSDKQKPREDCGFDFADIVDLLLRVMGLGYRRFNEKKLHIFTFFQVSQNHLPPVGSDERKLFFCDFVRIVRGEHTGFQVIYDANTSSVSENPYMKTFENIYVGSSVEGAAVMTIMPNSPDLFIEQFKETSLDKRYFWIYILSYIQRLSLLNMARELSGIDNTSDKNVILPLRNLRDLSKRLSRIQVNTFFSDVSDITQHNQFYRFCCRNLGVERLLAEVGSKMNILNDCLLQEYDEKKSHNARIITLCVSAFALISACCDGMDLLSKIFKGTSDFYPHIIRWMVAIALLAGALFIGPPLLREFRQWVVRWWGSVVIRLNKTWNYLRRKLE